MVTDTEAALGSVRHPRQQCRVQHVAPVEEFPVDKWDQIIAINLTAAFRHPRGRAGDEAASLGPHLQQHGLGAFARGLALQVRLRVGQARARGPDEDVALEVATFGITVNCISPGYVWTPLVWSARSPTR